MPNKKSLVELVYCVEILLWSTTCLLYKVDNASNSLSRPLVHSTCPFHKPHVHLIRIYLNIFKYIWDILKEFLENMSNMSMLIGLKDMFICLSRPFRTSNFSQMPNITTYFCRWIPYFNSLKILNLFIQFISSCIKYLFAKNNNNCKIKKYSNHCQILQGQF